MQSERDDPPRDDTEDDPARADRDERRIEALERMFRSAYGDEPRLNASAMRKIGAALRGDVPGE